MAAAEEEINTPSLYETRDEKMVSSSNINKITFRTARFLKPFAKNVNQTVGISHMPLLHEVFPHNLQEWPSKVLFKGWRCPQREWTKWVQNLAVKHKNLWQKSGIYDAILSSTCEIRCNIDLVLGLVEFWSPETSGFLFPWGEATITLEDMMILGGYSVTGHSIRKPPTGKGAKIVEQMERERSKFYLRKARKVAHSDWLKHYMGADNDFEHVAFLSLWLSRYVFPDLRVEVVGNYVFPIASILSQGIPMALGPAVLASLYVDLTFLKKEAMSFSDSIAVAAPFQLLQLWAFEHFPSLAPKTPNSFEWFGEPRAFRWSKLYSSRINLQLVRSALRLKENFVWRPYAANLKNWQHPSFYGDIDQFVLDCSSCDKGLRSFVRCLQGSELVGIDFKEKYQPQRVARQFGFDQDIPGNYKRYNVTLENVSLYVPSRSFEPGVSARYSRWWEESMATRKSEIRQIVARKESLNHENTSTSAKEVIVKCGSKGRRSPAFCRNTLPKVTRERNDETDLLPISMLRSSLLRKRTPSSVRTSLGKSIQGSKDKEDHDKHKDLGVKPQSRGTPLSRDSEDVCSSKTRIPTTNKKRKLSPLELGQNDNLAGEDSYDLLDCLFLSERIKMYKKCRKPQNEKTATKQDPTSCFSNNRSPSPAFNEKTCPELIGEGNDDTDSQPILGKIQVSEEATPVKPQSNNLKNISTKCEPFVHSLEDVTGERNDETDSRPIPMSGASLSGKSPSLIGTSLENPIQVSENGDDEQNNTKNIITKCEPLVHFSQDACSSKMESPTTIKNFPVGLERNDTNAVTDGFHKFQKSEIEMRLERLEKILAEIGRP